MKTIVIIGAGPTGLAALKAVLDAPQFSDGLWTPLVLESRPDLGGVWLPGPPPTPLYDSLTTNLPHPLMAYEGFPFPPSTPVFPKASVVHEYLTSFADRFDLRQYITFNTPVLDVTHVEGAWEVKTSSSTVHADLLLVCNGHYAVPRYPNTSSPNLSGWVKDGYAFHSMCYRKPLHKPGAPKKVLIVGAGPSGQDLCADHLAAGFIVVHSTAQIPSEPHTPPTNNLIRRPRVALYDYPGTGKVIFEDGTEETDIALCWLATGYSYSYPFFSCPKSSSSFLEFPPPIPPLPSRLYNSGYSVFPLAQHIWPLLLMQTEQNTDSDSLPSVTTSLAFLGLLSRVSPLPLVQVQARAALASFAHPHLLNPTRECTEILDRYNHLRSPSATIEDVYKSWHKFEPMDQYDYRDGLSAAFPLALESSAVRPWPVVPQWHREMYAKKGVLRRTWVALEESGEADARVRGVGAGDDSDAEWEALLRRLVEKGEEGM